jgi:hypothetical protein
MSALISRKKGWAITREAFDGMLAELHPDIERAGEQAHCFYKIIDAVSGCLYPQPRYILLPPLRRTLQTTKLAKQSKSLLRSMRRIDAPFNDCRLVHFDIAVRANLKPSGLGVEFNRLDSSHDQAVMGWGAACASLRW